MKWYNEENVEFETSDIIDAKTEIAGENLIGSYKSKPKAPKRSLSSQFVIDCSFYTNTQKFFRTDNGGKISCLNGLRVFSMIWIIFGHT